MWRPGMQTCYVLVWVVREELVGRVSVFGDGGL